MAKPIKSDNVTSLQAMGDPARPLDWIARGVEVAILNNPDDERVMITVDRDDAIKLVRMIDKSNGPKGCHQ